MDNILISVITAVFLLFLTRYYIIINNKKNSTAENANADAEAGLSHPPVKNRIDWIDCAKGIAVLLVIIGHTYNDKTNADAILIRGSIYSFHIPLFFILSGTADAFSNNNDQFVRKTEKAFKNLILPALIIYIIQLIFGFLEHPHVNNWSIFLQNIINAFIFGSGTEVTIGPAVIFSFGMKWFLIVMFCGRILFDYLHLRLSNKSLVYAVLMGTALGITMAKIQWLPGSFDIALAVLPFFLCGACLKQYLHTENKLCGKFFCASAIWCLTFAVQFYGHGEYLNIAERVYPVFPLCYITAIAGSLGTAYFCQMLLSKWKTPHLLLFLGKHSLCLYCIHILDSIFIMLWYRSQYSCINSLTRIAIDTAICTAIVSSTEYIKSKRSYLKQPA